MSKIPSLTEKMKAKGLIKSTARQSSNVFLPKWQFRWVIVGESGSGKTELVYALLVDDTPGVLNLKVPYDRIYIFATHLDDDEQWQYLIDVYRKIEKRLKTQILWTSTSVDGVVPLDEIDPTFQNLIIFDDFMNTKNQEVILQYFTSGRHLNCSSIYLSQSYKTDQNFQLMRKNSQYFSFFRGSNGDDLKNIYKDFRPKNVTEKEFIKLYDDVTSGTHDFIMFDKATDQDVLKFRKNLDGLYF